MSLFTGLTHYWKLDETSGARANSVGTPSLVEASSTLSVDGKSGRAAKGDPVFLPYMFAASGVTLSQPRTISCWAKLDTIASDTYLFSGVPANDPRVYVDTFGDTIVSSPTSGNILAVAYGTLSFWHLVVLKMESNIWSLSVDGSTFLSAGAQDPTGDAFYVLGAGVNPFNGAQDEIAVWSRALSQAEVSTLWNNGAGHFYGDTFPTESALAIALQKPTAKIVTLL